MNWKYLIALDYIEGFKQRERILMRPVEEKAGRPALPIEGGLETFVKVSLNRLRVTYEYPIQLLARLSGIDYAYRKYIVNNLIKAPK